jgi:4-deoxy-L-threo-5-hexosulose-uronate ketol-isomerase
MDVRYTPDNESYKRMTTAELRKAFVLDALFEAGRVTATYCDCDRVIVGGAVPTSGPLLLEATKKEMAASFFAERREIGITNVGGAGSVKVDGAVFDVKQGDMLYIGRGSKSVEFMSGTTAEAPAYYYASYPAHASYPTRLVTRAEAGKAHLGALETSNKRTINKYIFADGAPSAQLVMGMTELETGSVWNTMPPHTHQRRMEVYLYYGIGADDIVVHLMGEPSETRSLILRNRQAVIAPSWSIHCASATRNYAFVWAMGGENQEFGDMDPVAMTDLL